MTIEEIIERAKKVCFSSNPQDYIQFVGELAELKPEQLPANLDEAAESYSENRTGGIILDDEVKAFKAGAKWMAEQGYSEETYVYANRFNDENEAVIQLGQGEPERGGFKPGDKVIVQIRKEE